ncbi:uncharacterized protein LOC124395993 [Silurus meridionalis]|uniref:Ig-like domain-containing protein n=1 Tax=Silurus meridionalis TaxID=175797 RepID=A0A8T0B1G2_SILME|nr:uncharacterized protein LOC124395993 [Silurus meridionalis]XP_046720875.1 uncharacterized protein LOC124395993 [Silurus meridionalis]KAF7699254.1 hypothetical protein HF521_003996 [Silurus meridionalis]
MNLRHLMRLLLFWSTLYLQTPDGSAVIMAQDLSRTNFKMSRGVLKEKLSTLQIKPKITVSVILGNSTELQCRNESGEALVVWWQTPFGSFGERHKFSNKDPLEMNQSNLRIPKVMLSHTGLYSCHLVDSRGGHTVKPYTINVLNGNTPKTRTRIRTAREAENLAVEYTHFAAAVASSVLVTFIGAFTLGAFSQPYVIKCLQKTRARMCPNKHHRKTTRVSSHKLSTVFFHRNANSEDDTVDFVSIKAPSDGAHLEHDSISKDAENSLNSTSNREAGDEDGAEHNTRLGSETIERKRVSRVIKVYNYDEDGNRFSHINEPEDNPTPRQRVMSLTRLQSIMSEAESPNFSTSKDSNEPDEGLSMTLNTQ